MEKDKEILKNTYHSEINPNRYSTIPDLLEKLFSGRISSPAKTRLLTLLSSLCLKLERDLAVVPRDPITQEKVPVHTGVPEHYEMKKPCRYCGEPASLRQLKNAPYELKPFHPECAALFVQANPEHVKCTHCGLPVKRSDALQWEYGHVHLDAFCIRHYHITGPRQG